MKLLIDRRGGHTLAMPAAAQAQQKVRINLASAFPTSLTLIGEAPVKLAQKLNRLSGGTLELRVNEPGALVPALQAIQATGQGSVDAAWSNAGFFAGDRHRVQHVRLGAVRARHPGIPRVDPPRRRPAALARDVRQARRLQHPVRHHPAGSLGLVPPRDQVGRGPEGPEDALLRPGRARHEQARRRDPAARAGRHLPGAAARHHRRHRVLAAGDGPEARLPPGGEVLLLPRLAPAGDLPRVLHQPEEVGVALRPAQGDDRVGLRRPDQGRDRRGRGHAVAAR